MSSDVQVGRPKKRISVQLADKGLIYNVDKAKLASTLKKAIKQGKPVEFTESLLKEIGEPRSECDTINLSTKKSLSDQFDLLELVM